MTTCADCRFLKHKETKKSKIPYGYCKELKIDMIAVQINCKHHKEIEKGTA